MANQGFVRTLNLAEVTDGAKLIKNLAGGTVDEDLRVFAGLSAEKSRLFFNRFKNSASVEQSNKSLEQGVQFQWDSIYTYTDDDYLKIIPINLIRDFDAVYIGFDADGVLTNNTSGTEIIFDRGEGFTAGVYDDVILQGGSGSGATANIVVNSIGEVASVEITNNGNNYQQNDVLTSSSNTIGAGNGFAIRIIAFPWRATIVLNYAWDVADIATNELRVDIRNTVSALDGVYDVTRTGGLNTWGIPNDATVKAFDINRKLYAQEKITNNIELYDIDGDGSLTQYDADLMNLYYNQNYTSNQFITYVQNNPTPAGSSRVNGLSIYNYLTGLDESVFDVDGTGENSFDFNLISSYVTGNGILYQRPDASVLSGATEAVASASLKHAISISARISRNPSYTISTNIVDAYELPYVIIQKKEGGQYTNYFDNFAEYGTRQICTTNLTNYNLTSLGIVKTWNGIKYRIADKYTINGVYYVIIVASGTGFPINTSFGINPSITPTNSIPVFSSTTEYGVFDSNGANKFFVRTNPRSSVESNKEIVLFSDDYVPSSAESDNYDGLSLPTPLLIPDLLIERDDTLTLENVKNLEQPEIFDQGNDLFASNTGSFSYDIDGGYAGELEIITNNVEESTYLRSTKYRIDRNLYYEKEIVVEGTLISYDPDQFNTTQIDLEEDESPGIYISSSLSQVTNPLASDFANKTRSFSSDYNPWRADPSNQQLVTQSLNVSINDLVWTNEIALDLGTGPSGNRFKGGNDALGENLNQNFNTADGSAFKLKININGEDYYLIMKKP
jgi:hypothetical protein